MYYKLLGALLTIASSTAIGFLYSNKFKKRVYQLKSIERAVYEIKNEILYTYTPLPELFSKTSEKSSFPINKLFESISNLLKTNAVNSVYEAFIKGFQKVEDKMELKKEDKDLILNLAKTFGESDVQGHMNIISLTLEGLKKQITEGEIAMKKNIKMYRYLGFTIGMMIVITLF
ncbi:stage III sporulation protein SpoAB [Clostridium tetani]|uniref:Stage III sporulation protein AB n=2 Tax=Clostridium tetani TaxID=1513 RepID=Q894F9_CLOTE|nr:stage III sporulation protein SpoIIIAB [Clostridium tetani]CDI49721.1 stage III sporulation protein SpoAB [Clostridium tetani 12124569]AAO36133.1 stage III sporulation protein AB [Clostridium tetani E88]AVP54130.1 stage III sporulation protein SpoAB [Clostridium tetani]KGI37908.1 stage III sporulation protein AB [Clostridium tetani]KGI39835.1 stage III sporulation protein AB [Clostridium tetani ATCC 9441]